MATEDKSSTSIQVDSTEEVTISRKSKYETPPFIMAGSGEQNRTGKTIDAFDTICNFSKPEQYAFRKLYERLEYWEEHRNIGNLCEVRKCTIPTEKQQSFDKGIRDLIEKGLVKRPKKEHYIINPNLIVPPKYLEALVEWDNIK